MTTNATTARAKLDAMVSTRTIDQICDELTLLETREYTAEVAIVHAAYCRTLEARFIELFDRALEIDSAYELAHPDTFRPLIESLTEARKELGI